MNAEQGLAWLCQTRVEPVTSIFTCSGQEGRSMATLIGVFVWVEGLIFYRKITNSHHVNSAWSYSSYCTNCQKHTITKECDYLQSRVPVLEVKEMYVICQYRYCSAYGQRFILLQDSSSQYAVEACWAHNPEEHRGLILPVRSLWLMLAHLRYW